jgi:hypothetical protein
MLGDVDTNALGLLLIAVAVGGFSVYWLGRGRPGATLISRLGAITVVVVLVGLMTLLVSAALTGTGD